MARDKKYPNIDFHIHNKLPDFIDLEKFKDELVGRLLKFKQQVKVFFISNPKINNIINTNIDLLLIIAVENKDKNFLIIENNQKNMYFNNLVIPIKFMNSYTESDIIFPDFDENNPYAYNILVDNGIELAIDEEINELKWGTKKYLEKIWSKIRLEDQKGNDFTVYPYPILWIFSSGYHQHEFKYQNVIYAPYFGVEELLKHLNDSYFDNNSFASVYQWSRKENKNNKASYELIDKQVEALIDQIEKDNQLGTLTKKKIQRLNNLWAEDNRIYEKYLSEQSSSNIEQDDDSIFDLVFGGAETKKRKIKKLPERIRADKDLDKNLVIISGKAGSGKTTEMLLLMKKCYKNVKESISEDGNIIRERSAYYLTYNKLLTHDVRFITDKYHYGDPQNKIRIKTIHKFLYDLVDGILVLAIMANKRIEDLVDIQKNRHSKILESFRKIGRDEFDLEDVFHLLGDYWDQGEREYYLLLKSYIGKITRNNFYKFKPREIEKISNSFLQKNLNFIKSQEKNNVFFRDYYEVLRNVRLALEGKIEELYQKLDIENLSDDFWRQIIKEKGTDYDKTVSGFRKLINRSFGGVKGQSKVLFIDEAQDCHSLERDIFLTLWGQKNIVVCSGGKEQLIRHKNECNWLFNGVNQKPVHNIIHIEKKSTTFRMKPKLVELCNFIAEKFQVKLDLSAHNTDTQDLGNVVIEFGDKRNISKIFEKCKRIGEENGLSNYESILFLTESLSLDKEKDKKDFVIDENNNLIEGISVKGKTSLLEEMLNLKSENIFLHNQKHKTGEEDEYPSQDQYRSIFYESCRGLEAWSVMCLDLDLFYQRKYDEEIAATFLSDDLLLTENERREKYAITWVLMALTRPIDSLYISLDTRLLELDKENTAQDIESKLSLRRVLAEFAGYNLEDSYEIYSKSTRSNIERISDKEVIVEDDIPF